ncbi:hypothetical protein PVK06_033851 [Gossypium arboreum]|uniref:Uncharacterized protein n=1 Tax=Gossypium arboreum TaxID=29729 RepID=A0ABR0NCK0_GOSAR|nr:hypothetical protein PVK06_033851 [Gossypium arboreum]
MHYMRLFRVKGSTSGRNMFRWRRIKTGIHIGHVVCGETGFPVDMKEPFIPWTPYYSQPSNTAEITFHINLLEISPMLQCIRDSLQLSLYYSLYLCIQSVPFLLFKNQINRKFPIPVGQDLTKLKLLSHVLSSFGFV